MMREHEDGHVIRRIVAPPALPAVVRPGPRIGPNMLRPRIHAPTFVESARREIVVDAGGAAVLAVHLLERARGDEPLVQLLAAHAERILQALVRAGAVAVERD